MAKWIRSRAERPSGLEQLRAVGSREHDRAPLRARRENARREVVRDREIALVGRSDPVGQRERLQGRDRQAQLGIDAGRERARKVERRLLGLAPLLVEERDQRHTGHQRERQDRDRDEQQQPMAQRHRLHRAPISDRRSTAARRWRFDDGARAAF